jgi:uncharacterized protein (TIGR03437 family)
LVIALTLFCALGHAVTLQSAFMAKAPSDASCNPSPQVTSFLSTDATAWLYVSVNSAAAGDVLKVEWVRPDGQVQQTSQLNPLAQAGDYCYDVHLSIAGTSAATALGTWTVRGLWNGSSLFTVTFTLASVACTYSISPASLTFGASGGSGTVSVTAGAGCSWTAASNVSWITITSGASGSGGGTAGYSVAANTSTTSRTGTLTVAGQTHTVTQAGAAPCTYSISPSSATVAGSGGAGSVAVTAGSGCAWTASSGVAWVSITSGASASGNGTVSYSVAANPSQTPRTGALTIAGQTFTVNQQAGVAVSGPPQLSTGGVTNAADYSRDFAPGIIVSIFGTSLASTAAGASQLPLPTTLEGASVEVVDGSRTLNAPLFYVSPTQINAQLPFGLTNSSVQVRVRNAAGASSTDTITILPRAPRLFTKTMDGKGEAIVLHADYKVVSAASPAKADEIVILYLTGLGAVDPAIAAGSAGGDGSEAAPLNLLTEGVSVTVGGRYARVHYAGLAPYFAGLYQVNFQMPSEMPGAADAVVVSSGGRDSQANVTVACASNWQAVGSGSIGSGGGTVTAPGITLTAPAGAFAAATTLTLLSKSAPSASALDAYRTSEFFALSGLPDTINAPMTVKLDISRSGPSGGDTLVMLQDLSGVTSGPIFLPASVQGNQLVATIPAVTDTTTLAAFHPGDQPPSAAADGGGNSLWTITGVKTSGHITNSTGNFIVYFSDATLATASALLVDLDRAYSKLGALGLDGSKRTNKPIQVNLYPFTGNDAQTPGLEGSVFWGRQRQQLDFNSTLMTDATTRRVTAGHELFHLLQNLYDPRTLFQMAKFSSSWLWMLEASATWFERLMVNDPNFVPSNVNSFRDFLTQHGLEYPPGDTKTVQNHGYGAAMFLEHVSKQKGDSAVAEVIKLMAQGEGTILPQPKYSPVEALNSVLGGVGAAWLQFCENYMAGSVYAGFPTSDKVNSLATGNRASFAKETDPAVTFTWNAPDLSARVYSVSLALAYQWPANTKLTVSLTDPGGQAEAIIYKTAGGAAPVWSLAGTARAAAAWEYADVAELVKNHVSLVIMVANGHAVKPYTGTTPITLQAAFAPSGLLAILQKTKVLQADVWCSGVGAIGLGGSIGVTWNSTDCPLTWSGAGFSWGCTARFSGYTGLPTATCTNQGSGTVKADGTVLLTIQGTSTRSDPTDSNGSREETWSLKNFPCDFHYSGGYVYCGVEIQSGNLADHLVQWTVNGQPAVGSGAGSRCTVVNSIQIGLGP